jgi:hypothetical protein
MSDGCKKSQLDLSKMFVGVLMLCLDIIDSLKSYQANKLFPKPRCEAVEFRGVDFYDK